MVDEHVSNRELPDGNELKKCFEDHHKSMQDAQTKKITRLTADSLHKEIGTLLATSSIDSIESDEYKQPIMENVKTEILNLINKSNQAILLNITDSNVAEKNNEELYQAILELLREEACAKPESLRTAIAIQESEDQSRIEELKNNPESQDDPGDNNSQEQKERVAVSVDNNSENNLIHISPSPPGSSITEMSTSLQDSEMSSEQAESTLPLGQWKPGGENEHNPYILMRYEDDHDDEGFEKTKQKAEDFHKLLRQDYLSTTEEQFSKKHEALNQIFDYYLNAIRLSQSQAELASSASSLIRSLQENISISPKLESSTSLPEQSQSSEEASNHSLREQIQKVMDDISKHREKVTNAKQPYDALNGLSWMKNDISSAVESSSDNINISNRIKLNEQR